MSIPHVIGLGAALCVFVAHCHIIRQCSPAATRCVGNTVQICDADGNWFELMDCNDIGLRSGDEFRCQMIDELDDEDDHIRGHSCVRRGGPVTGSAQ